MAHPILLLVLLLPSTAIAASKRSHLNPSFSAVFYFGDSVLDTGNNNHIMTLATATHFPYGQSFPGKKPTGRFSDGRLIPDLLNEKLQLKEFSPPFLVQQLSDHDILTGVNFASAGSGFDDNTARMLNIISMSKQVELFKGYLPRLRNIAGDKEASRIIANSLILINSGGNDFMNYYISKHKDKRVMEIGEYQDSVLQMVQDYVKELFHLGGRQFCIAGLGPCGCTPLGITWSRNYKRACVEELNKAAQVYNSKLKKLLTTLQDSLHGCKIVYLDTYEPTMEILDNPAKYGFVETRRGCCGTGLVEFGLSCNAFTPTCENVSSYVWYDALHPTESFYRIATDYIMKIQQF